MRSDCTTRNVRRARALDSAYDALEARIDDLREREELAEASRPDLDGDAVQLLLGIGPSRAVGQVLAHLRELKLEHGPLGDERAREEVLRFAAEHGIGAGDAGSAGPGAADPGPTA